MSTHQSSLRPPLSITSTSFRRGLRLLFAYPTHFISSPTRLHPQSLKSRLFRPPLAVSSHWSSISSTRRNCLCRHLRISATVPFYSSSTYDPAMVTPTSSSQSEVRDNTREQEGTKPKISNQQQLTASSSVAPSAPALPQGSPERPTTGPIVHAAPTLVEPTISASDRLIAAHEAHRRALAEEQVQQWQSLPQPNAPQHPVYRRKKDFLKKGIVMLPMNDPQIDDGQVCPFCLNRYTNDSTYLADLYPLADLHGRVPTNAAGGDDVAHKVLRCNHIFHLECLKAMKFGKCMSCNIRLFHRSVGRFLQDVGKKSCYDGGEWD